MPDHRPCKLQTKFILDIIGNAWIDMLKPNPDDLPMNIQFQATKS